MPPFNQFTKAPPRPRRPELMEAARDGGVGNPGDVEAVKTVLRKGANLDEQDEEGFTALLWAACLGHTEVVRLLISEGAAIDVKDNDGRTALIWAAWNRQTECARLLIDRGGAVVNIRDKQGWTALMYAANVNHAKTVQLLVDSGANINESNNSNQTALDRAMSNDRPESTQILENAMARETAQTHLKSLKNFRPPKDSLHRNAK
ncbi:MAG: ankyrin repeat domain-containing protein [Proteobacteria bacterium]|nr:ankyrin repeat domain-containing protein [Pseudomonadota bacterium]